MSQDRWRAALRPCGLHRSTERRALLDVRHTSARRKHPPRVASTRRSCYRRPVRRIPTASRRVRESAPRPYARRSRRAFPSRRARDLRVAYWLCQAVKTPQPFGRSACARRWDTAGTARHSRQREPRRRPRRVALNPSEHRTHPASVRRSRSSCKRADPRASESQNSATRLAGR